MTRSRQGSPALRLGLLLAVVGAFGPSAVAAQAGTRAPGPTNAFVVAGYGTAGWQVSQNDGTTNSFFGSVSPLFLFRFGEKLLYEAELEFELEEGATATGLEYAQVDYFLNDRVTIVAGKFLLPFGVFGERLHPTWINKFASNPPILGHHGGGPTSPLLPVAADLGVMVRTSWVNREGRGVMASLYVTQGPTVEGAHGEAEETAHADLVSLNMVPGEADHLAPIPEFQFGGSATDNNTDKMVGGRLAWLAAPSFELDLSALTGKYDTEGSRLTGVNLAAEYRRGGTELRGEGFMLWYDVDPDPEAAPGMLNESVQATTGGYYLQLAHRRGSWEPVLRWTQALKTTADTYEDREGYWQVGFGLDYWLTPSVALMGAYELSRTGDDDLSDRFVVHWSFGF